MSLRHIQVLLRKEFKNSAANFFILYTVAIPLILSLFVSAVFGSLFSEKPKLGVFDEGESRLVAEIASLGFVNSKQYDTFAALEEAVARGAVDAGVVIPDSFDEQLSSMRLVNLDYYVWGQSHANSRATLTSTLYNVIYELAGQQTLLNVNLVEVGDAESLAWDERLLPLIMIIVVIVGGMVVPASSLIDEREKRTIHALITSPISLEEVFFAKGVLGVVLSVVMGIVALVINQAFGTQPVMLIIVLVLSAIMAAEFGLLMGTFISDMNSFFALIKMIGILLYAPALIMMFPSLPQWIAKIFPTYYIIGPVADITIDGQSWTDVLPEVGVLFVLTVIGAGLLYYFGKGERKYAM